MAQKQYVQAVTIGTTIKEEAVKINVSIKVKSGNSALAATLKQVLEENVKAVIEENDVIEEIAQ